eukprot:jgi/Chrzof1/12224/Cz06g26050.t1
MCCFRSWISPDDKHSDFAGNKGVATTLLELFACMFCNVLATGTEDSYPVGLPIRRQRELACPSGRK